MAAVMKLSLIDINTIFNPLDKDRAVGKVKIRKPLSKAKADNGMRCL
jgi:hypothetical protein